jgi:hypothetical protein
MPQPFIDALSIQSSSGSAPLLVVGFELRFQRRELGERRIRIRHLFPPFRGTLLLLREIAAIPIPARLTVAILAAILTTILTLPLVAWRTAFACTFGLLAMVLRARPAMFGSLGSWSRRGTFGGNTLRL